MSCVGQTQFPGVLFVQQNNVISPWCLSNGLLDNFLFGPGGEGPHIHDVCPRESRHLGKFRLEQPLGWDKRDFRDERDRDGRDERDRDGRDERDNRDGVAFRGLG